MSVPVFPPVPAGRVHCRVAAVAADGADVDLHPDWVAKVGQAVTIKPLLSPGLVFTGADEPILVDLATVSGVVNADGYIVHATTLAPVYLVATDAAGLSVTGWLWEAEFPFSKLPKVRFPVTSGSVVELTDFVLAPAVDETQSWVDQIPALIELLSGGGGTGSARGLVITDATVATIPDGDTTDNLAAYYNSGASAITVAGVELTAGSHAVWVWVSGVWVLLSSGTTTPPVDPSDDTAPAAPTGVTVTSVTETTATLAWTGSVSGDVVSHRYSLDGMTWTTATTPASLVDLTPGTQYVAQVQAFDGANYSTSALGAFETAAASVFADDFTGAEGSVNGRIMPTGGATWISGWQGSTIGMTALELSGGKLTGVGGAVYVSPEQDGYIEVDYDVSAPGAQVRLAARGTTAVNGVQVMVVNAFGDVLLRYYNGGAPIALIKEFVPATGKLGLRTAGGSAMAYVNRRQYGAAIPVSATGTHFGIALWEGGTADNFRADSTISTTARDTTITDDFAGTEGANLAGQPADVGAYLWEASDVLGTGGNSPVYTADGRVTGGSAAACLYLDAPAGNITLSADYSVPTTSSQVRLGQAVTGLRVVVKGDGTVLWEHGGPLTSLGSAPLAGRLTVEIAGTSAVVKIDGVAVGAPLTIAAYTAHTVGIGLFSGGIMDNFEAVLP